ncbi:MAG: hypothetical protein EXR52_03325 [Dehalococcoidia bacterium]|nr:hypothetical protein [Dehalococcoidia bacterium]
MTSNTDPTATAAAEAVLQQLRDELRRSATETPPPIAAPIDTPTPRTAVERLLGHVTELQERWPVAPAVPAFNRPVIGPVLSRVVAPVYGRVLRALAWPLLQPQIDFNAAVVRYAQHAYQMIRILQDEARYLRQETSEYDHHAVAATRRLAVLEQATQRMAEQVAESGSRIGEASPAELTARLAALEEGLKALQGPAGGAKPS